MQRLDLYLEVIRHRRAMRLVLLVDIVAKGFALGIEHHGHVFGLVLFAQLAQHIDHTINGTGRLPLAVGQRRQGMKSPKQVGRAINQYDGWIFFSHG